MTEDEGGEMRERKQTASVVEKGQGEGAREKIKNRGEGVETKLCSFMRARGAGTFSLTQMIKRWKSAGTSSMIYLWLISCTVMLLLLVSFDNSKWCFLQTVDLTPQCQHQLFIYLSAKPQK